MFVCRNMLYSLSVFKPQYSIGSRRPHPSTHTHTHTNTHTLLSPPSPATINHSYR